MNQETNRIIKSIEALYHGKPWFGDNLLQQLDGIDAKKPQKSLKNSIIRLLKSFITSWLGDFLLLKN